MFDSPGKDLPALYIAEPHGMMGILVLVLAFLVVPSSAFAWGPMTHMYLANELFAFAPLIPAGILALIKKHKQDFIYGNLMADSILGKKYLPDDKSSHSWDVALKLLDQAKEWPERAFAYGYLSHLAADTVAHETLTDELGNMGHTWIEMKADSMIKKSYWLQMVMIKKAVKKRSDLLLESALDSYLFSVKTNKRIYKSMVFFAVLNKRRERGLDREYLCQLHEVSIARMLDLLQKGTESPILRKSPL